MEFPTQSNIDVIFPAVARGLGLTNRMINILKSSRLLFLHDLRKELNQVVSLSMKI
jgi:hypothetical protein